jgi:hypothetical protein
LSRDWQIPANLPMRDNALPRTRGPYKQQKWQNDDGEDKQQVLKAHLAEG